MRKFLGILVLSLSATVAYANTSPPQSSNTPTYESWLSSPEAGLQALDNYLDRIGGWLGSFGQQLDSWLDRTLDDQDGAGGQGSGPVAAPEFDPAGAMAALTLLAGGLAVLRGRRTPK